MLANEILASTSARPLWALVLLAFTSACGSNNPVNSGDPVVFELDFSALQSLPTEVAFVITDYPVGEEKFHEISTGLVDLPVNVGTGRGLLYRANNHSDDIDSHLIVSLGSSHGLGSAKRYSIEGVFSFYSNVPRDCIGAGGSPESVVFRVCASSDPAAKERVVDNNQFWRLPLGRSVCGDAGNIGTNASDCLNGDNNPWSLETRTNDVIQVQSGSTGDIFLSISTHSGFEATSTFYYRTATLTLTPDQ